MRAGTAQININGLKAIKYQYVKKANRAVIPIKNNKKMLFLSKYCSGISSFLFFTGLS
jgi:hypothetical protein